MRIVAAQDSFEGRAARKQPGNPVELKLGGVEAVKGTEELQPELPCVEAVTIVGKQPHHLIEGGGDLGGTEPGLAARRRTSAKQHEGLKAGACLDHAATYRQIGHFKEGGGGV